MHSNPGYAYTHTDAFIHTYGFPHDPVLRWELEDEMIEEAEARVQRELDDLEEMMQGEEPEEEEEEE
jgi:hypothetical protein